MDKIICCIISILASTLSLPGQVHGAYYGFNQAPQDLLLNEGLLEGYEAENMPERTLQDDGSLRDAPYSNWELENPQCTEDPSWPSVNDFENIGQVAGLEAHKNDTLYIFHRADHVWDFRSFDLADRYKSRRNGPIANDTVLIVDGKTGKLIQSWGSKRFYMPHGISLDKEGNVWLTDVALHQVFRFKANQFETPDLILGQAFKPGRDWHHFCMPTDVAVASTGMVYISDGYCNSRILVASPSGLILDEIGLKDNMVIPYSLVLLEEENLICVADRENRRILCYTAGLDGSPPGMLMFNIDHPRLNRVFAIDHIGDVLFALSVPEDETTSEGIILDLATERILNTWKPSSGFQQPHDLTISLDKGHLFVSDLGPKASKKIVKFNM